MTRNMSRAARGKLAAKTNRFRLPTDCPASPPMMALSARPIHTRPYARGSRGWFAYTAESAGRGYGTPRPKPAAPRSSPQQSACSDAALPRRSPRHRQHYSSAASRKASHRPGGSAEHHGQSASVRAPSGVRRRKPPAPPGIWADPQRTSALARAVSGG